MTQFYKRGLETELVGLALDKVKAMNHCAIFHEAVLLNVLGRVLD